MKVYICFFICLAVLVTTVNCKGTKKCGRNEVYSTCGTCEETCAGKPEACIAACIEGCFCKKGYIRRNTGGECILRSACP
ncbi:hypothetical protein GWI33_020684 [Rhynchophorus ferrugineus]|uniref:TIL domain-containing protein n=1 Tax=Rhynchophorus ferrugineus TaxID=354439 RepID=A0A834HQH5_RHYFE|nr:hypothetical protein GWI33_020684 [Rhynchophorus ferrugineus]